ncbi:hypothetical protein SISSUDRAFT_1103579 [Sistotremastrum suecicum HHB10207 ss-3]|uniref:C2 domain-containing protein n=1 Tax=Sistotremastrum suecicum HHB10207 ss-3 TaxID=1314776 RepID=A0A165WMP9_9AGAM|nr:hypothetical protein SISSUDRAFT_1103579 [Sistotremastrum suecicum HHB10207 ss-3]
MAELKIQGDCRSHVVYTVIAETCTVLRGIDIPTNLSGGRDLKIEAFVRIETAGRQKHDTRPKSSSAPKWDTTLDFHQIARHHDLTIKVLHHNVARDYDVLGQMTGNVGQLLSQQGLAKELTLDITPHKMYSTARIKLVLSLRLQEISLAKNESFQAAIASIPDAVGPKDKEHVVEYRVRQ